MTVGSTECCSHVPVLRLPIKITNAGLLDPHLKQDKNPCWYSSAHENMSLNRIALIVLSHLGSGIQKLILAKWSKCV